MAAVSEADLFAAITLKMMTALETVDATKFTSIGSPAFEGSTSSFANGRNEKFLDLDGSSDSYTVDVSEALSLNQGIISFWIKPDFSQTAGLNCYIFDLSDSTNTDGITMKFHPTYDDWLCAVRQGSSTPVNVLTSGETWSADDRIHMVFMWNYNASLDNSKSFALYIDNSLALTDTATWSSTSDALGTVSDIGALRDGASNKWNGGIFDFAAFDYTTLAASYTDVEIVQALYDNSATFGGGTHKFSFELTSGDTPGLTIAGRKVRVQTDTGVSATTAIEWDDSQNTTVSGDILPDTDDSYDLGASDNEFKDLYIDGTANIDSLVADTADINAGTIDATAIGSTTPSTADFTTLANTGTYTQDGGNVSLNNANGDYDFTVNKNTAGIAIQYDAGDDNTCIGDGGTTNYTEIKSDGEINLHGTARVLKDRWIPAEALRPGGTSPAVWTNIGISGAYRFSDNAEDEITALIEIPADMDRSVAPDLKLGWATADTNQNDCEWYVEFLYRALGEDMSAAADFDDTQTDTAVAQAHGLNTHSIDMDTVGASDVCMQIKITRLAKAGSNDTIADNVDLYGICLEYTSNKLGTAT